jgi:endonuclease/exonuclease/phosphatase family metal-dependent hydrolase
VRVLTWNLFHGRSQPPARRELLAEFAALIAGWRWDAALLQEVPPWWARPIANEAGAEHFAVLTSRNAGRPIRRALARRWPELMRSNGGGCNAILAREPILEHRSMRLRTWPERRVAQLVRLRSGVCVANFHGSTRPALAAAELQSLSALALAWADEDPLVIGGDLNLRSRELVLGAGLSLLASRDVDHLLARGLDASGEPQRLDRAAVVDGVAVALSDHVPLALDLRAARAGQDVVGRGCT